MKPPSTPTYTLPSGGPTPSALMTFPSFLPALTAAFAVAIFVLDSLTKINMAIAVLYVVVVMMSVSFCTRRAVLAVSGACMAMTVLSFVIMHGKDYDDTSAGRCIVALSANAITTFLAVRMLRRPPASPRAA
jgi:two-component system sensor kinase FixL